MSDIAANAAIRLLVVASVRLYREGLAASLERRGALEVIGTAATADEAFARAAAGAPDLVILDMAVRDSLALVRAMRQHLPAVRVVAYAVDECEPAILACIEAGVAGYLASDGTVDDLVDAVHGAARGEMICSPRAAAALCRRLHSLAAGAPAADALAGLTAREREILALVERGLANKAIAHRLNIELATVKNHVHSILEKLGVASRAEAAARARRSPSSTAYRPRRSGDFAEVPG